MTGALQAVPRGDREWSPAGHQHASNVIARIMPMFKGLSRRQAYRLALRLIEEANGRYHRDPGTRPLGCRSHDCFSCCLFQKRIDCTAFDVGRILDQAEREGRLREVVSRASKLIEGGKGGACPLLSREGRCTVYKHRPLACAAMHSMDREACKDEFGMSPHAELLWIETHVIAGFGMFPVDELMSGKRGDPPDLFAMLAELGGKRLGDDEEGQAA